MIIWYATSGNMGSTGLEHSTDKIGENTEKSPGE